MRSKKSRFVLCLKSGTYKASLQPRKVYRVLDDAKAAEQQAAAGLREGFAVTRTASAQ